MKMPETERDAIRINEFLPHAPPRVWRALTDPDLLARWLMPNDFKLEVGHRFTFRGTPIPAVKFSGTVDCEVLDFEVERLLRIRWMDRGENGLDSTVTWRLVPEPGGTRLFLEHQGFDPEDSLQQLSRQIMSGGWVPALHRIGAVLGEVPR